MIHTLRMQNITKNDYNIVLKIKIRNRIKKILNMSGPAYFRTKFSESKLDSNLTHLGHHYRLLL